MSFTYWYYVGIVAILLVGLTAYQIDAHRCRKTCAKRNADPIGWWESEHGPIDWDDPDHVDPRLLECECR